MVELREFSNIGPLSLVIRDEPTLQSALESVVRYAGLLNAPLTLRLMGDGRLAIQLGLLDNQTDAMAQTTDLAIGLVHRILKAILGPSWRPCTISLARRAPKSTAMHQRIFGFNIPVRYGNDCNEIVCVAAELEQQAPRSPALRSQAAFRHTYVVDRLQHARERETMDLLAAVVWNVFN
jgi:hypothetical protein